MEAGPSTASPPAKMPGTLVARVSLSAAIRPPWPMVTMTVPAFSTVVLESSNRGLNFLFSSKTLVQARKVTAPF